MIKNPNKLKKDLEAEVRKAAKLQLAEVQKPTNLRAIGTAVVEKMKEQISRGISPIKENGRFPAYKWVGKIQTIRKSLGTKASRKIVRDVKQTRYPYSMMAEFPDKRVRPVNLKLSGAFIDSLRARVASKQIEISFSDPLSNKKELGHREGVGGQPKRPILPNDSENLNGSIFRALLDSLDKVLKRKIRS